MTRERKNDVSAPDFPFRRPLHRAVLRWYHRHGRVLPWRGNDNPYAVMVSEFMLQQTQVARVRERLPHWLERFPTVADLARASRRDVLLAWSGMGYNRRALLLHAAAREITSSHAGAIPADPAVLIGLPGVGRYTAHAVACFGYRRRVPMVDVNIRRILSRLSEDMGSTDRMLPERETWDIARALLPQRAYYDWNQALMDIGALVCTARRPHCGQCPAAPYCASAHRLASPVTPSSVGRDRIPRTEGTDNRSNHSVLPYAAGATTGVGATTGAGVPTGAVREVPRRIYRGRLIEFLRNRAGHCASAARLHRDLFGCDREEERARLVDILASLHRDGMITIAHRHGEVDDVHAFSASLRSLRVCLAE